MPDELKNSDSFDDFKDDSRKQFFSVVTRVTSATGGGGDYNEMRYIVLNLCFT